ncbi:hypothetical protein FRB90_010672 [Tulasnella sp. 427]|nr:hypothetical protein FRB90_010672 [Tulasnella sp. 427]
MGQDDQIGSSYCHRRSRTPGPACCIRHPLPLRHQPRDPLAPAILHAVDAIRPIHRDTLPQDYQQRTRPLVLNAVFHGIAAVASSCLAFAGIILQWRLTFVEQYLFLQALLVWSTYRLSTVLHDILPSKDRSVFGAETAYASKKGSSRAKDFIGEFSDGETKSYTPHKIGDESLNPDGGTIRMVGLPRVPEPVYQSGRPGPSDPLSSVHSSPMFAMDSNEAILGHYDEKEPSSTFRSWFARPRSRIDARNSNEHEPTEDTEANGSMKSHDCSKVEGKDDDDSFEAVWLHQANTLPVLQKYDPTSVPRVRPTSPLIASTHLPQNKSYCDARFVAMKHEVEQALQTVVSRHIAELDRHLREESVRRWNRITVPSVIVTDAGGQVERRVAEKKIVDLSYDELTALGFWGDAASAGVIKIVESVKANPVQLDYVTCFMVDCVRKQHAAPASGQDALQSPTSPTFPTGDLPPSATPKPSTPG